MPAAAVQTCSLDFDQVREISRLFATRKSCLRYDLGILMNRHSAVSSYLAAILETICGRICVPGGNIFPGHLMPTGAHSDERNPKTWRTMATNIFPVVGHLSAQRHARGDPLRSSGASPGGHGFRLQSPALLCRYHGL